VLAPPPAASIATAPPAEDFRPQSDEELLRRILPYAGADLQSHGGEVLGRIYEQKLRTELNVRAGPACRPQAGASATASGGLLCLLTSTVCHLMFPSHQPCLPCLLCVQALAGQEFGNLGHITDAMRIRVGGWVGGMSGRVGICSAGPLPMPGLI
jgi:hypothetical protein